MIEGFCKDCGKPIMKNSIQQRFCPECKARRNKESVRKYYKKHAEEIKLAKQLRIAEHRSAYIPSAEVLAHQADREVWCVDYAEKQKAKTLAMIGSVLNGK